jgi:hypothetical protein
VNGIGALRGIRGIARIDVDFRGANGSCMAHVALVAHEAIGIV